MVQELDEYLRTTGREQTSLPTVEGYSLWLGVDDDQINEWTKRYPEFHAAIKRLKALQKNQLMEDGLYGGKEVNSTMAIFLLKVNHAMVETSHTDITTAGKPLPLLTGLDVSDKEEPSD